MIGTSEGKRYGLARNVYGAGMQVVEKYALLSEANAESAKYLPGTAMVCTFSNGKWKPVWA